jgi:RimJ/RimL family protein N-acetyltransferase
LAAGARGRGIGKRAILAACEAWGGPVVAQIRRDNQPSRAAFEACGFVPNGRETYEWRP